MNNKGFTLIELLATIAILSVVGVIAYTAVNGYINTSRIKAEEKFLDEISTEIEAYLGLYGIKNFNQVGTEINFDKYQDVNGNNRYTATAWELKLNDGGNFTLNTLLTSDLGMNKDKFQNPRTGEYCNPSNIIIKVYKDNDYVYYYYVDMMADNVGCTALKNIDTRPVNLKSVLCEKGITNACEEL